MDNTKTTKSIASVDAQLSMAADALCDALETQNDFADNIEVLQDVTPSQWAKQVARAQAELRERVTKLYEKMNDKLLGGEFAQ